MKKIMFLLIAFSFSLSACLPAILQQPQATNPPTQDLNATAAILSRQTLAALSTDTTVPSITPQVMTPTTTPTLATPTETQNPILLTLTATLGTGTVIANNDLSAVAGASASPTVTLTGTPPHTATPSATSNSLNPTTTGTAHLQYSGTMPPNLPYGHVELRNKSKADVYISMRCVTKEGYVTIIEYPVDTFVRAKAPAGKYTYVVWVGGRKILGSFSLKSNQELTISIFKDRVAIK